MSLRAAFVAVSVIAACAYACGDELPESVDEPPVRDGGIADATVTGDAAAPRCNPDAAFGAPRPLDELNTELVEKWGRLTSDELVIVFGSSRPGTSNGPWRFFVATRVSADMPFSAPKELTGVIDLEPDVGIGNYDADPALSADGLDLAFTRKRSSGSADIWIAHRADRNGDFGAPAPVTEINTTELHEFSPVFSATGLWFVRQEYPGAVVADIFYAQRNSDGSYATPAVIAPPSVKDAVESLPSPSRDGLTLYFGAAPDGSALGEAGLDIWMTRRSAVDPTFRAASLVRELSTELHEEVTWVSDDGCRVYLHGKSRDEKMDDLYVADRPK
jgi:hypothetical protein